MVKVVIPIIWPTAGGQVPRTAVVTERRMWDPGGPAGLSRSGDAPCWCSFVTRISNMPPRRNLHPRQSRKMHTLRRNPFPAAPTASATALPAKNKTRNAVWNTTRLGIVLSSSVAQWSTVGVKLDVLVSMGNQLGASSPLATSHPPPSPCAGEADPATRRDHAVFPSPRGRAYRGARRSSQARLYTASCFHHGDRDDVERELRGFAMVSQFKTIPSTVRRWTVLANRIAHLRRAGPRL
jgi:hypothetical protein